MRHAVRVRRKSRRIRSAVDAEDPVPERVDGEWLEVHVAARAVGHLEGQVGGAGSLDSALGQDLRQRQVHRQVGPERRRVVARHEWLDGRRGRRRRASRRRPSPGRRRGRRLVSRAATMRSPSGKSHSQIGHAWSRSPCLGHGPHAGVSVAVAVAHELHHADEEAGIAQRGRPVRQRCQARRNAASPSSRNGFGWTATRRSSSWSRSARRPATTADGTDPGPDGAAVRARRCRDRRRCVGRPRGCGRRRTAAAGQQHDRQQRRCGSPDARRSPHGGEDTTRS